MGLIFGHHLHHSFMKLLSVGLSQATYQNPVMRLFPVLRESLVGCDEQPLTLLRCLPK
jgi:hypothetical protein